ncbi:TraR/DksA family transcriptional regulator [Rhizobium sophoriradicis]|uniref:TraR/DksA C4-type zinc finger protein n=1 Tax=Rhizobium TaxID=379 RepID=UPI00098F980E|nr:MULTISPECIES: TraR/DksA C4-type zinc finger protein [Rhizobium]ARQ59203.1 DksA/TraR C4-type zinc finger protein [Rhizobium sp. Kim5]RSB91784.1 TraR/DksA family transcriptional regulator [Rhizobium sophoriradicis]
MTTEQDFDRAEELAEKERQAGIRRLQAELQRDGRFDCQDCENEIEPARREAMPSATRCIACQARFERGRKRNR